MNLLNFLLLIFLISSCEVALLDKLEDQASEEFCPGIRNEFGECPTKNGSETLGWSFTNSDNFIFDEAQVDISGNLLKIKKVNLDSSEEKLNEGTHFGTTYKEDTKNLTLKNKYQADLSVDKILSDKAQFLDGYWKFENNPDDSSKNSLPSRNYGGPGYSTKSKIGSYSHTSGVGQDGVLVENLPYSTTISLSFWMYINENGDYRRVFTKGLDKNNLDFFFMEDNSKKFRFSASGACYGNYFSITAQQWSHVGITYGDGYLKVYLNGEMISQKSCAGVLSNDGANLNIGANMDGWSELKGLIDEFSYWTTILDATDIKKIYDTQLLRFSDLTTDNAPKKDSLISLLNFDKNIEDKSSASNTVTTSGYFYYDKFGDDDTSIYLGGTDGQIRIPTLETKINKDRGTISCWVKNDIADADVNNRYLFRYYLNSTNEIYARFLATDTLQFGYTAGGNNVTTGISSWSKNVPRQQWTHLAFSWDITNNSKITTYLNGKEIASSTQANLISTSVFGFFVYGYGTNGFKGSLNDCAVWSENLSNEEVVQIYDLKKGALYGEYRSPIYNLGKSTAFDKLLVETPLPYTKSLAQDSEVSLYPDVTADLSASLVGYWPLDEKTLNSTSDSKDFLDVINDNNFSESGSPILNASGVVDSGVDLDGVDDDLTALDSSSLDFSGSVSISTWIKSDGELADSAVYGGILGKHNFAGSVTYALRVFNSSYEFLVRQTNGTYVRSRKNQTPKIVDGKWHHILGVANASTGKVMVYVDGVLQTDSITSGWDGTIQPSSYNLNIGRDYSDNYFKGKVDEAAIWNRALSDEEAKQLYLRGLNQVKYLVRSCSTSDCSDANWIGAQGSNGSGFSEYYNNNLIDSLGIPTGTPKAGQQDFNFSNYVLKPSDNNYFQYKAVITPLEENSLNEEIYLPQIKRIKVNSSSPYFAGHAAITTKYPISIRKIRSITVDNSQACPIAYQISKDGSQFYFWNGSSWALTTDLSDQNSASEIISNQDKFTLGNVTNLYFKIILKSDSTKDCAISKIQVVNYK